MATGLLSVSPTWITGRTVFLQVFQFTVLYVIMFTQCSNVIRQLFVVTRQLLDLSLQSDHGVLPHQVVDARAGSLAAVAGRNVERVHTAGIGRSALSVCHVYDGHQDARMYNRSRHDGFIPDLIVV